MASRPKPEWQLVNGDQRALQHPEFEMPTLVARRRVRKGGAVKLLFELRSKRTVVGRAGELMWVRVDFISDTIPRRYSGVLEADPTFIPLKWGDLVEFGIEHIIDIEPEQVARRPQRPAS